MKYIFTLINLFLLAACAFFSADMVYKTVLKDTSFMPEIKGPTVKQAGTQKNHPIKGVTRHGHEIIVQRNLFKIETEKKEASDKDATGSKERGKLEPTTLSLTLWGTVTGGSDLYAVIEDKKSRLQALYQEGDSIQDATVKKISKKEVILTFQGKDQILEMETDPEKTGSIEKPLNKQAPRAAMNENQNALPPQPPPQAQQSSGSASEIMTNIKFRPFFTKGSPDGVMVYAIKPDSIFNRSGIRNGDIVKAVNGTPVSSVEDASSLLSGMENAATARLTLIRSGEIKEISYSAGSAARPSEVPVQIVPGEMTEEKLPDPPQDRGEIRTQAPEDQEPEKAEISEDKN